MKKTLFLMLALTLGIVSQVRSASLSSIENGITVGRNVDGNLIALTKVATIERDIELETIRIGDAITKPGISVITTALYVVAATGVTHVTTVAIPAALEGTDLGQVQFQVPWNYRSGGAIEFELKLGGSITQGQLSFTADVYNSQTNGLTSVAKTAGTAVQIAPAAETVFTWTTPTNAATFTKGGKVVVKFGKTGTTRLVHISRVRFKYRPYGVMNGPVE